MTHREPDTVIGHVAAIHRYPVKSMQGETLDRATVGPMGIDGDRRFAVIDAETGRVASAKNPRKWAALLGYRAAFRVGELVVFAPDGAELMGDTAGELSRRLGRAVHQALKMAEAQLLVEIEPELCRLDRDLRAEPARVDLVQDVQIMLGDLLSFFRAREVLAELGEDRADALRFLVLRGGHRVLEPLARHEGGYRSADERRFRGALTQPRIGGHRKQNLPRDAQTTAIP